MAMTKHEADNQLRQAIYDHAVAYGMANGDDELLNEYAVVAHWQKMEDDGYSRYSVGYHRSPVPHHVSIGLFRTAEQLIIGDMQRDWKLEDDEEI